MMDLRARPHDLCMSDASPFQQHYEYRTTHALRDVIHGRFFLPLRDQLYAGDSITLCRFDKVNDRDRDARLLEIATVRVIASGRHHDTVELHLMGQIEEIPQPEVRRGPGRPPKQQAA